MFKLFVFAVFVYSAHAGLIGGYGYGGHESVAIAAPIAVAAPVAIAHDASSYQNSNLLALNPTAVVTKVVAPVIAAPVITKIAAPIAVAAPISLGSYGGLGLGYGKGLGLGGYH